MKMNEMKNENTKYKKKNIFKIYFTIFPDTVQGGTVSNMGPVSPNPYQQSYKQNSVNERNSIILERNKQKASDFVF
jgi:hypothetical protein